MGHVSGQRLQLTGGIGDEGSGLLHGVTGRSTRVPDCFSNSFAGASQLLGIGSSVLRQFETSRQTLAGTAADRPPASDGLRSGFGANQAGKREILPGALGIRSPHADCRLDLSGLALRAPPQRRLTLGVEGRENEPTEKAKILEEVHLLLRPSSSDPTPPKTDDRRTSSE